MNNYAALIVAIGSRGNNPIGFDTILAESGLSPGEVSHNLAKAVGHGHVKRTTLDRYCLTGAGKVQAVEYEQGIRVPPIVFLKMGTASGELKGFPVIGFEVSGGVLTIDIDVSK